MGRMKEYPRYNIIFVRVSDNELAALDQLRGSRRRSNLLLDALLEKISNERQAAYDRMTCPFKGVGCDL